MVSNYWKKARPSAAHTCSLVIDKTEIYVSNIIIQVKETPEMFGKLYAQAWPGQGMRV